MAMLHPLVKAGLLPADFPATLSGVSGYSGGGKALIAAFEDPDAPDSIDATVHFYGLWLKHKHLPEVTRWSGLTHAPVFLPRPWRKHPPL